jgi:hypothetical protein
MKVEFVIFVNEDVALTQLIDLRKDLFIGGNIPAIGDGVLMSEVFPLLELNGREHSPEFDEILYVESRVWCNEENKIQIVLSEMPVFKSV